MSSTLEMLESMQARFKDCAGAGSPTFEIGYADFCEWQQTLGEAVQMLTRIELVARRHCNPSSNAGAHALAAEIIKIIERPAG